MHLQIRNNTPTDIVIVGQFNWDWGGSGGNGFNNLGLQPGLWSGDSGSDINGADIYWANFVSNIPGNDCGWNLFFGKVVTDTPAPTSNCKLNRGYFIHWGNHGVYTLGRPERRTYSWTVNDGATSKTAYILTFSSSASNPDDKANRSTCPNGVCTGTKIFMKIDQITAP